MPEQDTAVAESSTQDQSTQPSLQTGTSEVKDEGTLLGKEVKETPVVPEKYELKVPEGMTVDSKLVEGLTPVFKEIGLSQESAQKLADAYSPVVKAAREAEVKSMNDEHVARTKAWGEESKQMLGADYEKALAFASKLITKGTDSAEEARALRQDLEESGYGNKPSFVKLFHKLGKLLSEDHFTDTGAKKTAVEPGDMTSLYKDPKK